MILPNVFENFFSIFFLGKTCPPKSQVVNLKISSSRLYQWRKNWAHLYPQCFKSESDVIRQLELLVRLKRLLDIFAQKII